jgi:hypothetical protein
VSQGSFGQGKPGAKCSARHPIGRQRCQLPLGHAGDHVAQRDPEHFPVLRMSWKQGVGPTAVEKVEQYRRALQETEAVRLDPGGPEAP